jgi:dienelactone hydrolase
VISLDQFLYYRGSNAKSYCAYAKPGNVLKQQSRYLLVVTNAVIDSNGHKVKDDGSFKDALKSSDVYYASLASALDGLPNQLSLSGKIISASLFTTMSATSWLEDARDFVHSSAPGLLIPAGLPYQFQTSNVATMTWQADTGTGTTSYPISLDALSPQSRSSNARAVGSVAFGLFMSPNYLNPGGTITTNKTKPVPIPNLLGGPTFGFVPVSFHVFLPSGSMPSGGWPVVIYGHGLGDSQFGAPTYIASTLAANGYATLAIEITGHGYGPNSTVALTDKRGNTFTVSTPGRGVQLAANAPIGPTDGCIIPGAVAIRDCGRQTAVDLFALVKAIQQTGRLTFGLDPQHIYYVGQSFGTVYGTLFHAVEPSVQAAALSAGGGTNIDVARLTITGRQISEKYLYDLGLLNPAAQPQAYFNGRFYDGFNDEYVYRGQIKTDDVPGALAIQGAFEAAEWLGMLGDPLAYAPHLKNDPLAGVPAKSTFFQYSWGDLEEPNPANSALIRAAGIESSSWLFRFDWALAPQLAPQLAGIMSPDFPLPILPHRILSNPTIFSDPAEMSISLAEQRAVAAYFNSGGQTIPNPNQYLTGIFAGVTLFQQLIPPAQLPESLNYIQIPQ